LGQLRERYAELAGETDVAESLASLGGQLGPASGYEAERRRKEQVASVVFGDGVPVYRRSGQDRVSLIVADQTAATFSYTGDRGPTVVPASMLQSAGIEVADDAEQVELVADDRVLLARRVRIPRLRVGKIVVEGVDALALPPEAEDLGAKISGEAFGKYRAALDRDRLWFRLR
jgi:hypothetical protein